MRCFLPLVLLVVAPAFAQAPHEPWRTLETERFRVHYPAPYEEWARHATARLESIADGVAREVGFEPPGVVEVLVMDPRARANGLAIAQLGAPRMVLWAQPPGPETTIGHFVDWIEELSIHEQAHVAHLLRPSRNPYRRVLERFLPVGPIARRAPRWVSEGYATLLEGELTGAGRPYSDLRSAVLRRWAQAGRLPSYGALSDDRRGWMGQSMAYLVGSAYLEWLRDAVGEQSLRHLWARMTARQDRSFEEAFRGVFGDGPAQLYGRFRAELTRQALELEDRVELQEGDLWQQLRWSTGPPTLAPQGDRLAVVLRSRRKPARLVVWSTSPDEEAESEAREKIERVLALDPEDVAPVRRAPLPREPLYELRAKDHAGFFTPRWMPDGEAILHVRFEPDGTGVLHPDLFLWEPEEDHVRRLTRGADLRQADPDPSGRWAVAVRNRFGGSQLVRVELASGAVEPLHEPSVSESYFHPRVGPGGDCIVYVRHAEGRWQLRVRQLESASDVEVTVPEDTTVVAYPEWSGPDQLRAVLGRRGFLEIHEVDLISSEVRRLTTSSGASLAPASVPGGEELYFLSLQVDGLDLRRLELNEPAPDLDLPDGALARPAPSRRVLEVEVAPLPEASAYGSGRQEWLGLAGGAWGPSDQRFELGVRAGDVVGRLDSILLGSVGQLQGGTLASRWRGWPVEVSLQLYGYEEQLPDEIPGLEETLDGEQGGLEIGARWTRHGRSSRWSFDAAALADRFTPAESAERLDRTIAFAGVGWRYDRDYGRWRSGLRWSGRVGSGRTGRESWRCAGARGAVSIGYGAVTFGLDGGWNRVEDALHPREQIVVGGIRSSLSPDALEMRRVRSPALPAGILIGAKHLSWRSELRLRSFPVRAFYEAHRVRSERSVWGDWLRVAGVEIETGTEPVPLLRLPGFELRTGLAVLLESPFPELENEIQGWLAVRWSP